MSQPQTPNPSERSTKVVEFLNLVGKPCKLNLQTTLFTDYSIHIHIPGSLKKLYSMSERTPTEDWYRCVNCGDLMLDQRTIPISLSCNTCGNGHSLVKLDPVTEAKAWNEAIERMTV